MRAYRLLLRLYPASFRREYGGEMARIFASRLRNAGVAGRLALWLTEVPETITNASMAHWDLLCADLRDAARTCRRAPGFAVTTVLVVALGVAAATAAFSVTDFVLIRPLPFPDAARLVKVWERPTGYTRMELSPANLRDWQAGATTFEHWGAYRETAVNLIGIGEPQRVDTAAVSADLLRTLGIQPLIGRAFTADDDRAGAPGTALLAYAFWRETFGGDPGIVGRRLTLDDEPFEVIGVMPPTFRFPTADVKLWAPLRLGPGAFDDRTNTFLQTIARLRPGATIDAARAELSVLAARSRRQYPKENQDIDISVFRLRDEISSQSALLLVALSGAAACVLLIACANVANLLLARGIARRRELAVRAALGAGRERLVRQLLTETLTLTVGGAALGIAIAAVAVPLLARLVPPNLPIAQTPAVDLRVLAFGVAVAVATALAFGIVPVLRAARERESAALQEGPRVGGGAKERARSVLVATEVMASVVLLASTGLLLRALWTIQHTDPGFRADGVLTARTALPMPQYGPVAIRERFYGRVLEAVRTLPGVRDAAYVSFAPMTFRGGVWPVSIGSEPVSPTASQSALLRYATPHLFAALGVPILRGRDLAETDDRAHPFVAVVSESFVRRYFPDRDPIGQRFTYAFAEREIVGVAGDIRARGIERLSEPQVYLSYKQVDDHAITLYAPGDLIVRAAGVDLASLAPAIRAIVRQTDPELPVSNVRPLADIVAGETASRTVQLRVVGGFAGVALLLAAIGIHGVLSFAVAQRTQEIGIRMALGARGADILLMIAARSAVLAGVGTVPGVLAAYAAGRSMQALLAGVRPDDPATFAIVVGATALMTIGSTLAPAIRAVRVDAISAIRAE